MLSARALARDVRAGRLSSLALVETCLRRIAEDDPRVHALVALDADTARRDAAAIDAAVARGEDPGPLAGLPMTIKDMHDTAGLTTSYGLPWRAGHRPERDSVAVARLRAAGAVILGKTALPLAGYDWQTRHPRHAVTNHPLDPTRTCGGSSGGAAVALALGFTCLELGADLAGSIRVPSHFCGTFGLKTTEGLVPVEGHGPPESQRVHLDMVVIGPMGRCVDDLALELDVLTTSTHPPSPRMPRRIACTDTLCGVRADHDTRVALDRLLDRLRRNGVEVIRATPPGCEGTAPLELWGAINGHQFARCWPWPLRTWPLRQGFRFGPAALVVGRSVFSRALARGMASSARSLAAAQGRRADFARRLDDWLGGFDAFFAPCAATPAFTHRARPRPIDVDGTPVPYSMAQSAFCCPFNLGGGPALAMPIGSSSKGLPIGVQCCAPRGSDRALLDLGLAIERLG